MSTHSPRALMMHRCTSKNVFRMTGGFTCKHCKFRYCIKHSKAESHGCGADEIKAGRVRVELSSMRGSIHDLAPCVYSHMCMKSASQRAYQPPAASNSRAR